MVNVVVYILIFVFDGVGLEISFIQRLRESLTRAPIFNHPGLVVAVLFELQREIGNSIDAA